MFKKVIDFILNFVFRDSYNFDIQIYFEEDEVLSDILYNQG